MTDYLQAVAGVLVAAILSLTLSKTGKETAMLLTMAACCMVAVIALRYLEPVWEFLDQLRQQTQLDSSMVSILLKVVGIGLIAEIAALVCTDAGNTSLGKSLQILASALILWLAIPLLNSLMTLVTDILGGI